MDISQHSEVAITYRRERHEKNRSDHQPFKLDEVKEALHPGYQRPDHYRGEGFRPTERHTEIYRGAEYIVDFIPKVKLELILDDGQVATVLKTLQESARTGKIGDGKIFVLSVEEVIRIRTGETGARLSKDGDEAGNEQNGSPSTAYHRSTGRPV